MCWVPDLRSSTVLEMSFYTTSTTAASQGQKRRTSNPYSALPGADHNHQDGDGKGDGLATPVVSGPQDKADGESATIAPDTKAAFPFLLLPAEIRLQIYHALLLQCPMRQPQLCPWYPSPRSYSTYLVETVIPGTVTARRDDDDDDGSSIVSRVVAPPSDAVSNQRGGRGRQHRAPTTTLLSPHRPLGYIPQALLCSCRRVYAEARTLPFEANEFVFVGWFSSGLAAARAFVGAPGGVAEGEHAVRPARGVGDGSLHRDGGG